MALTVEDLELDELAFRSEGLCQHVDPEIFFPAKDRTSKQAKQICAVCPVQLQCMWYAVRHNCLGIWGGTSDRERMRLRAVG